MIGGDSLAHWFGEQVMGYIVVIAASAFAAGAVAAWMLVTPAAPATAGLDVDLEPCSPRAATVPGPGWGFATCRPDQVGEVMFSPAGQAVLNCVCGD